MPPFGVVVAEDVPHLIASIERDLLPDAVPTPIAVRNRRKDGTIIWMEVSPRLVRDPLTGEVTESVIVLRDITNRKLMEERLAELAFTDGLTGLSNRRAFDDALSQEWEKTVSEGGQMSLILIDVDHFKSFNDAYGHQAGDQALVRIASVLSEGIRYSSDSAARYGGEEFVLVLADTKEAEAIDVAERLRLAVAALRITHAHSHTGHLTISMGVASYDGSTSSDVNGLIELADEWLYQAKQMGRNRVYSAAFVSSDQAT